MTGKQKNEGEGNRTAAREYNKHAEEFARSGKVEKSAAKARDALEGNEGESLKRAQKEGLKKARH